MRYVMLLVAHIHSHTERVGWSELSRRTDINLRDKNPDTVAELDGI